MATSDYQKIENDICPECGNTLTDIDLYGDEIHVVSRCYDCGMQFELEDDMGGSYYRIERIEGGKRWKTFEINEIIESLKAFNNAENNDSIESAIHLLIEVKDKFKPLPKSSYKLMYPKEKEVVRD